jgi:translation initiation factor IF-2
MTVQRLAAILQRPVVEVVFVLFKQNVARTVNEYVTAEEAKACCERFGAIVEITKEQTVSAGEQVLADREETSGDDARLPVVVVMGHVDHGKTTLLDYLRKANVADKEKGGITQHLGAYEVSAGKRGSLIFLDTPGHEAFGYMRQRGTQVTDLAVIIVAANDGVKPQTVEAINLARGAGVPIVVAINKVDKAGAESQIETIKTQLAQHDLTPEEWGGDTVCVPISAKTGKGIDQLLDILALHAEMLDLKTRVSGPARAFVLETKQIKGQGAVATVMCREGTLCRGDYFVCGDATGRVRIMTDSAGNPCEEVGPSVPVQVAGFDSVEGLSDRLVVVSVDEYSRARSSKAAPKAPDFVSGQAAINDDKPVLRFLFKSDTQGSCQALVDAIEKLAKKEQNKSVVLEVMGSGVGAITESDVQKADNANALLFALHVRPERSAHILAKQHDVTIKTHTIIYHLIEEIEELILAERRKIVHLVPAGTAEVLKVFPVKGQQAIAGCMVHEGVVSMGDKVVCIRRKQEIGSGIVTSLQRDRREAKEVHEGNDCGFLADTFHEWRVGDTVRIFSHQTDDQ